MGKKNHKSGVIKQILKEHFDGFWKMHFDLFPSEYREQPALVDNFNLPLPKIDQQPAFIYQQNDVCKCTRHLLYFF